MDGKQKVVGDPADARLGLAVSQSIGAIFIRALTYRASLIRGGDVIEMSHLVNSATRCCQVCQW